MPRDDLHFRLRIPADLKASIEASAKANNRSMTAEIVNRLQNPVLDLRDFIAAQAMAAIITKSPLTVSGCGVVTDQESRTAYGAYGYADAMIAAREGGEK